MLFLLRLCLASNFFLFSIAFASDFTFSDLQNVTQSHPRVIFYFVSAGMPLSESGLVNVRLAAREMDYELRVLHDPLAPLTSEQQIQKVELSPAFQAEGVFLHFPSMALYQDGRKCGSLVAGFKDERTYRELIAFLESRCEAPPFQVTKKVFFQKTKVTVVKETILPHPIRYFYHPLGLDWIAYHTGKNNFLYNRRTGREITLPGRYDVEPTPDEVYVTIPAQKNPSTLSFYSVARILSGPDDQSGISADFQDPQMTDQYQSAGVFRRNCQKFYRMATSWFSALRFRDYLFQGGKLTAQGNPVSLCSQRNLSTPMISPNGQLIGAVNNATGTTQVLRVGAGGESCNLVRDVGIKTGKVAFDFTGNRIAFSAVINGTAGVFVESIGCQKVIKIADAPQGGYVLFPKFLKNGNLIYLKNDAGTYSLVEVTLPY